MKEILRNILREESVQYITEHYSSLRQLANATVNELMQIPYVGNYKAKELKTIFDIGKGLLQPEKNIRYIKSPGDAYELLKILSVCEEERAVSILLDTKNRVVDQVLISKGSLNSSIIHPREVFTAAVRTKASAIVLAHNHPSNEGSPSTEDIETTKRIQAAGEILGIRLLDHIIVTNTGYTSLKEKGLM